MYRYVRALKQRLPYKFGARGAVDANLAKIETDSFVCFYLRKERNHSKASKRQFIFFDSTQLESHCGNHCGNHRGNNAGNALYRFD